MSEWQTISTVPDLEAILPDVERLIEALRKYGKHQATCTFREWYCSQPGCDQTHTSACTCGLDAALALFDQPVAPKETK